MRYRDMRYRHLERVRILRFHRTRAVAFLALLVLALNAAFASAASQPTGKIVVVNWQGWSNPTSAAYQEALEAFRAAYPGIEVDSRRITSGEFNDQVIAMMAAGLTPDVTWMEPGRVASWGVDRGWLADLTPYIERSGINLSEYIMGASMYPLRFSEGKVYGLAVETFAYIFYYNKDHYQEAGLAFPTRGWTWDDFLQNAIRLTRPDLNRWGYQVSTSSTRTRPWVWQGGGDWWNPENLDEFMWHLPESMIGLQFLADLMHVHRVAPTLEQFNADNTLRFSTGRVSMQHEGVNAIPGPSSQPWPFAWGPAVPPRGPGGEAASVNMEGFAIFEASENKDAAWAWIEWWLSDEGQRRLAEFGRLPAKLSAMRDYSYLHLEPALRDELQGVLAVLPEIGRDKLEPAGNNARQPFNQQLDKVWSGEQTVQQAVDASIEASRAIHEAFLTSRQR